MSRFTKWLETNSFTIELWVLVIAIITSSVIQICVKVFDLASIIPWNFAILV